MEAAEEAAAKAKVILAGVENAVAVVGDVADEAACAAAVAEQKASGRCRRKG